MIEISLCMIVKNEEKILARCLDSVADLVDEIVIVDTGSTDATKKIAANYTDKIYDFTWVDDFSAARNFAFSKAEKDYIYTADADEMKEAACVVCRAARIRKDAGIMMKMALKDMLTEGSAEMCFELGEYFHERGDDSEASLWYYNAMHEAPSILNIHTSTDWPEKRLAEIEK